MMMGTRLRPQKIGRAPVKGSRAAAAPHRAGALEGVDIQLQIDDRHAAPLLEITSGGAIASNELMLASHSEILQTR
jgi:hypothetical protein